jgi:threonyl-tRNA synthetase
MADTVKDAVNSAVEGVKNIAVSAEQKAAQKENKAPKPKKEKKAKGDGGDGRPLMLDPPPAYIDHRIQIL